MPLKLHNPSGGVTDASNTMPIAPLGGVADELTPKPAMLPRLAKYGTDTELKVTGAIKALATNKALPAYRCC